MSYDYEIEKSLAKFGGEADKGIKRTCGNCESYDAKFWQCCCADAEDNDFHKKTDAGCYYHRTHEEQNRIRELVKKRQDQAEQKRIADNRKNGTGDCAGCLYREKHKDMCDLVVGLINAIKSVNSAPSHIVVKINDNLVKTAEDMLQKLRGEE